MSEIKPGVVALMGAMCALGGMGDYLPMPGLGNRSRGPSGHSMKVVGKTEDGEEILQDRGGRQYVKSKKGTIRRLKK